MYWLIENFILKMMLNKTIYLLVLLLMVGYNLRAQKLNNIDKKNIKTVIHTLFEGMRQGDSAKVHSVCSPKIRMLTAFTSKSGKEVLHEGNLNDFLVAVGTPHEKVWDERLSSFTVDIDDRIAQVWTDYQFYIGETFSHCGVNAFQLLKTDGIWKIIQILDTRRKSNCND